MPDPRTPVLVGVGTSFADAEAAELMVDATVAAGADAGAPGLLRAVQRVVVPRGTWSYTDPARIVADRVGARDATTVLVDVGIPQQTLLDEAMAAIGAGDLDVALVVGAEAKARSARAARRESTRGDRAGIARVFTEGATAEAAATETDQGGARPDVHQQPVGDLVDQIEIEAGLWAPVEQYALIESALAASEDTVPSALGREIAQLWSRFNDVAQENPDAAFPAPMSAEQLATFSAANRPLAFPYAKWHASQWTVDQAAALLLCTSEAADRFGVPQDRRVHPLVGVSSSHTVSLSRRRDLGCWPAMEVLGSAAATRTGEVGGCDHIELYSCFPSAVRVQQRALGIDLDRTPTITGGMAFAGGPFNSYVLQAMVAMVGELRERGGRGLITSVSGLLTKPGLGVWASEPDGRTPLIADLGAEAATATATVPVVASHQGRVTVEACTATFDGLEPVELVALLATTDGTRVIGRARDAALIDRAMGDGLVGHAVHIDGNTVSA